MLQFSITHLVHSAVLCGETLRKPEPAKASAVKGNHGDTESMEGHGESFINGVNDVTYFIKNVSAGFSYCLIFIA